ncbi:MAG: phenylalanine--tRNA ligase subunit alpha [Phycisphaeraceae bacterium]|nr:phenylalanine--tRNA ligase subunit alpha [Phycisphaerales bacterium]MCB9842655.1 phenylalanine--tRNA ligase subunit alpha [Phycisphaeraceae bacterium]
MIASLDQLEQMEREALASLAAASDAASLESWRIEYLGGKGKVKAMMGSLKDVPKEEKPAFGKRMNEVRVAIESAFGQRKESIGAPGEAARAGVDLTEPGLSQARGRRHIITRVREELCGVFGRMGFDVAEGPELEDDEHNFVKLNIPEGHPAREPIDNFYIEEPDGKPRPRMLRTQTSTVQIRVLERALKEGWGPPVRIVAPGRVYRPDTVDATHSFMFHQIEGLYVDRRVTMVDLKTTLFQFARTYFGADAQVRLRPSFFPFTEPSAEFDMMIRLRPDQPARWIELGGCGMVDPEVLKAVGVDPEQWTGFAFGFGVDRIAMGKYRIPDIRMLFDNDLRFLDQL